MCTSTSTKVIRTKSYTYIFILLYTCVLMCVVCAIRAYFFYSLFSFSSIFIEALFRLFYFTGLLLISLHTQRDAVKIVYLLLVHWIRRYFANKYATSEAVNVVLRLIVSSHVCNESDTFIAALISGTIFKTLA